MEKSDLIPFRNQTLEHLPEFYEFESQVLVLLFCRRPFRTDNLIAIADLQYDSPVIVLKFVKSDHVF